MEKCQVNCLYSTEHQSHDSRSAVFAVILLACFLLAGCSTKQTRSSYATPEALIIKELGFYCEKNKVDSLYFAMRRDNIAHITAQFGSGSPSQQLDRQFEDLYPVASLSKILIQQFAKDDPHYFNSQIQMLGHQLTLDQTLHHQTGLLYPEGTPLRVSPPDTLSLYQNGNYALVTDKFWNSKLNFQDVFLPYLSERFALHEARFDAASQGIYQDGLYLGKKELEWMMAAVHDDNIDSSIYWNLQDTDGTVKLAFGQSQDGYAELFHDPESRTTYLLAVRWMEVDGKKILPEQPGLRSHMFCRMIPSACPERFLQEPIPFAKLTGVWKAWKSDDAIILSHAPGSLLTMKVEQSEYYLHPTANSRFIPSLSLEIDEQEKLLNAKTLGVLEFQDSQRPLLFWNDQVYFNEP